MQHSFKVFKHVIQYLKNVLSEQHLAELAHLYNIDLKSEEVVLGRHIKSKLVLLQRTWFRFITCWILTSLKSVIQVGCHCSHTCKKSFGTLCHLRNQLRRTMGQSRLRQLAVMVIEKDGHRFATRKERRHKLMLRMKDQITGLQIKKTFVPATHRLLHFCLFFIPSDSESPPTHSLIHCPASYLCVCVWNEPDSLVFGSVSTPIYTIQSNTME